MFGSAVFYLGLVITTAGLILFIKPIERFHVESRSRALLIAGIGVVLAGVGLTLPARESRITTAETRLDEFVPVWQFNERHTIRIAAPPARAFEAIKSVRADEISLFNALTWIRRGGRELPESILNAGDSAPLLDVATRGGFIYLADEAPREVVVGTVVSAPRGTRGTLTPEVFKRQLAAGFVLAAMNFLVTPDGPNGSLVSTETRVFANSSNARRRFARYWRAIYPGSALIRVMWLRAVRRRAMTPAAR
ncbi:MAG TPA: hypothetical protein VK575_00660 [Gemmatimonadaceae bacterium]|nr:hypothetical protein [Gemmatimonadaceae bacterium]